MAQMSAEQAEEVRYQLDSLRDDFKSTECLLEDEFVDWPWVLSSLIARVEKHREAMMRVLLVVL